MWFHLTNMSIGMASSIKFQGQYWLPHLFFTLETVVKIPICTCVFNVWWCDFSIGYNRDWYNGTTVKNILTSIAQFFFSLMFMLKFVNMAKYVWYVPGGCWRREMIGYVDKMFFSFDCRKDINVKSAHGTLIVFLQNAAGYAKWGPTPERLKELHLAYRPKDSVQ